MKANRKANGGWRKNTTALVAMLYVYCMASAGGCAAADPKPRATLTPAAVSDEGPKNPSAVDAAGARASTVYPSTAVMLRDATEAEPATLTLAKPSSTTTAWSGPFDTWLDAAGVVTARGIKAKTGDGATIEAQEIVIDNQATLAGAAQYARAIETQVVAMSADQREAYRVYVTEFASTVRQTFPDLADLLLKALLPVP